MTTRSRPGSGDESAVPDRPVNAASAPTPRRGSGWRPPSPPGATPDLAASAPANLPPPPAEAESPPTQPVSFGPSTSKRATPAAGSSDDARRGREATGEADVSRRGGGATGADTDPTAKLGAFERAYLGTSDTTRRAMSDTAETSIPEAATAGSSDGLAASDNAYIEAMAAAEAVASNGHIETWPQGRVKVVERFDGARLKHRTGLWRRFRSTVLIALIGLVLAGALAGVLGLAVWGISVIIHSVSGN